MISRAYLFVLIGLVVLGFAMGGVALLFLPNPAPIHWNIQGHVDGYGSPRVAAFMMPSVMAGMAVFLIVLPALGPFRQNFERFARTYGRICITLMAAFLLIHAVLLWSASGHAVALIRVIPAIVGVLIAALGNWMGKVRRNFFVGIRTPWTLANDVVWERTHRVGGWIMVAYGLLVAIAGLALPPVASAITIVAGALALVVWALAYSCWLYHHLGAVDRLE